MTQRTSSGVAPAVSLAALILLATNLRPALTSVGPLLEDIRQGAGISVTAAGLLNSLPLLAFALFSPLAHFGRRFGMERTLVAAMVLLAGGIVLRSQGSPATLFGGSIVLAAGIAIGNVLVPGLIKRDYPARVNSMTITYVLALGITSALASGIAVPLSHWLPGGWRAALGIWALLAVVTALVWLPRAIQIKGDEPVAPVAGSVSWRSPLAWQVTVFMGLQSLLFYVAIGWFPVILQDTGYSADAAGFLITIYQILSLAVGLAMPPLLKRAQDQSLLACAASLITVAPVLGLVLMPNVAPLWVALMGIGGGACFVLALAFIGLRSANHHQAASLSVMAQSIGYLLAATGPFTFGLLHDLFHNWRVPLIVLFCIGLIQAVIALGAGRNRTV